MSLYDVSMDRIFIIEDDNVLKAELARLLELQGFEVVSCNGFSELPNAVKAAEPDCVVLDLKLPDTDGHMVCRDIRQFSDVPIIVLTSSDSDFGEVMALGLGANDYVTKPYRPAVLLARIQAILRRNSASANSVLSHDGVSLDLGRGVLIHADKKAELTRNELTIMQLLMRNGETTVSRQDIMYELWESDEFIDDNTLTVNVNRLRKVLESIGAGQDFIKTHRGIGYSL